MSIMTGYPWREQPCNFKQGAELTPWTQHIFGDPIGEGKRSDGKNYPVPSFMTICRCFATKRRIYFMGIRDNIYDTREGVAVSAPIDNGGVIGDFELDRELVDSRYNRYYPISRISNFAILNNRVWGFTYKTFTFDDNNFDGLIDDYEYNSKQIDSTKIRNKMDGVKNYWIAGSIAVYDKMLFFYGYQGVDDRYLLIYKQISDSGLLSSEHEEKVFYSPPPDYTLGIGELRTAFVQNKDRDGGRFYFFTIGAVHQTLAQITAYSLEIKRNVDDMNGVWKKEVFYIPTYISPSKPDEPNNDGAHLRCVVSAGKYIYIFFLEGQNVNIDIRKRRVGVCTLHIDDNASVYNYDVANDAFDVYFVDSYDEASSTPLHPVITSSRLYIFSAISCGEDNNIQIESAWTPFYGYDKSGCPDTIQPTWRHPAFEIYGTARTLHRAAGNYITSHVIRGTGQTTSHQFLLMGDGHYDLPRLGIHGTARRLARQAGNGRYILPARCRIRATGMVNNDWVLRFERKEVL